MSSPPPADSEAVALLQASPPPSPPHLVNCAAATAAPFPFIRALALYLFLLLDSAAIMAPFPITPLFLTHVLHTPSAHLGAFTGITVSAFFLGTAATSSYLGHLSDRVGRKPVLVVGALASAAAATAFPLVPAIWAVAATRLFGGALNANASVARAYLVDIAPASAGRCNTDGESAEEGRLDDAGRAAKDSHWRGVFLGFLGANFIVSRALASVAVGALTGPLTGEEAAAAAAVSDSVAGRVAEHLKNLWVRNAFVPPCFVFAGVALVAAAGMGLFMEESLKSVQTVEQEEFDLSETAGLQHGQLDAELGADGVDYSEEAEDACCRVGESGNSASSDLEILSTGLGFWASTRALIRVGGRDLTLTLALNALLQFTNGALLTVMVLFFSEPLTSGGLELSPHDIGVNFGLFGAVAFMFQLFLFPPLLKAFGPRLIVRGGAATMLLAIAALACAPYLPPRLAPLAMLPTGAGFIAGVPLLSVLIANAAPAAAQGLCQGHAAGSGALARAAGPVLSGALFSAGVRWGAGAVPALGALAVMYVAELGLACGLSERLDRPFEVTQGEGGEGEAVLVERELGEESGAGTPG